MQNKRALIIGISGQDGPYLSKNLLSRNIEVYGTTRTQDINNIKNLKILNLQDKVKVLSMNPLRQEDLRNTLSEVNPSFIINLSGLSSVGDSFKNPVESINSNSLGVLNLLECCRKLNFQGKLINAGSSECFGNINNPNFPADENTIFKPKSPYAAGKCAAFYQVKIYRESFNLNCGTCILSNHESPLRSNKFIFKKMISTASKIKNNLAQKITLGNINIIRDWGWADDYMNAICELLLNYDSDDFIIATGKSYKLIDIAKKIFKFVDLDLSEFIVIDEKQFRPNEISKTFLNPNKIYESIGWKSSHDIDLIINKLFEHKIDN